MRGLATGLLLAVAACSHPAVDTGSVLTDGSYSTSVMTSNLQAASTTLSSPMDRIWALMPMAYDSLGLEITMLDPATHVVAAEGAKLRHRLGTVSLSRYIDCGQAQIGPSADSYDIVLAVTTKLVPAAGGATVVGTTVEALAKSASFAADYSRCSSTGLIEKRIASIVQARLAHP